MKTSLPPIGDVTIGEGRGKLGNRITIIAGVAPLAEVHADQEEMKAGVRKLFGGAGSGDHFILNLAAYPHKNMEETKAVVDECRKYQRMSI